MEGAIDLNVYIYLLTGIVVMFAAPHAAGEYNLVILSAYGIDRYNESACQYYHAKEYCHCSKHDVRFCQLCFHLHRLLSMTSSSVLVVHRICGGGKPSTSS